MSSTPTDRMCVFEQYDLGTLCTVHKSARVLGEDYCSAVAARTIVRERPTEAVCGYCSISAQHHPEGVWARHQEAIHEPSPMRADESRLYLAALLEHCGMKQSDALRVAHESHDTHLGADARRAVLARHSDHYELAEENAREAKLAIRRVIAEHYPADEIPF